jgi:probable rRNA maturation factor
MKGARGKIRKHKIDVIDLTGKSRRWLPLLKNVLAYSLQEMQIGRAKVSLSLIGDAKMKRLNRKYRGIARSTDVLSFAQDGFSVDSEHLGDILIATPTARRQARKAGKPVQDEFSMLAVHGLLHLLGYDHDRPAKARRMFSLQKKLLTGRA